MSNYSQIIQYGPKDSLTHGDPNKAIKGVQLDAEFSAIQTAVTTKYDSSTLPSKLRIPSGADALQITAGGAIQGLGPVAAAFVDLTPDTGTFTANYTGFTGSVTGTASWYRVGKIACLLLGPVTGTSNSGSFTLSNLPAAISPPSGYTINAPSFCFMDNGVSLASTGTADSTVTFGAPAIGFNRGVTTGNWTSSGTKSIAFPLMLVFGIL